MVEDFFNTNPVAVSKARLKAYFHHIAIAWGILDSTTENDPLLPRIEVYTTDLDATEIEFQDEGEKNASLMQYGVDLEYLNNFETEFLKHYSIKKLLDIGNEPDEPYLDLAKQRVANGHLLYANGVNGVIGGFERIEIDTTFRSHIHFTTTHYYLVNDTEHSIQWIMGNNEFIEPKNFFLAIFKRDGLDNIITQLIDQGSHALLSMLLVQVNVHPEKRNIAARIRTALQSKKEQNNTQCETNDSDYIIEDLDDLMQIVNRSGFTKKLYHSMGAPECVLRIIASDINVEPDLIRAMIQYAATEHDIQLMNAMVKRYPEFVSVSALTMMFIREATLKIDKTTRSLNVFIEHVTANDPNYWLNLDKQHPGVVRRIFLRAANVGYVKDISQLLHSGLHFKNLFKITAYGNGMNAFHIALANKNTEAAKIMLDASGTDELAFIRETGSEYEQATPLHLATRYGHEDIIRRLLYIAWKKGRDFTKNYVLTPTNKQKTAVHYAAELNTAFYLRAMLSCIRGTSLATLKNQHGLTPLHYATVFSRVNNLRRYLNMMKHIESIMHNRLNWSTCKIV